MVPGSSYPILYNVFDADSKLHMMIVDVKNFELEKILSLDKHSGHKSNKKNKFSNHFASMLSSRDQ